MLLEQLEDRHLLMADLAVAGFSASELGLVIDYEVTLDDAPAFEVGIYRSADGRTPDALLMSWPVDDPADLAAGAHRLTIRPEFADVPEDYFLVARLDAGAQPGETQPAGALLADADLSNNQITFRGGIFQAADGTVHIHGSGADESFGLADLDGRLEIWYDSESPRRFAGFDSYSAVHVRTHGGDDRVSLFSDNGAATPLWAFGGTGDDVLGRVGGEGAALDTGAVDRGSSHMVQWAASDDVLLGGLGTDQVAGIFRSDIVDIVDDAQLLYTETGGGWQTVGDEGAFWGGYRTHAAGSGESTATWTFDAHQPGKPYEILATWAANPDYASNAPYTIFDGPDPVATVLVDQRVRPTDLDTNPAWQSLGVYTIDSGRLTIQLSNDADGPVIADAVGASLVTESSEGPSPTTFVAPAALASSPADEGGGGGGLLLDGGGPPSIAGRYVFYDNC